jgi:RHS repeat-associated protein
LGSTSYVTNLDGNVVQHVEYIPFGEVFLEERNNVWNTPYLFNSKELDEETGLYYYGARYYNPRESVWLSVDKPLIDGTYMSGIHNGGVYNSFNLNGYMYCYQNPVRLIDPDGNQVDVIVDKGNYLKFDAGHTFVSIGSGTNRVVYSYGRWAGTYENNSGSHTPLNNGNGVMLKLTGKDAVAEIQKYVKNYDAQVYRVGNVNETAMKTTLEKEFNKSQKTPSDGKYKEDARAHVIDEYLLMSNNCTTKTMEALKKSANEKLYYNEMFTNESGQDMFKLKLPLGNSISPSYTKEEFDTAISQGSNANITNVTKEYK